MMWYVVLMIVIHFSVHCVCIKNRIPIFVIIAANESPGSLIYFEGGGDRNDNNSSKKMQKQQRPQSNLKCKRLNQM